jgi:hypothetical protein
MAQPLLVLALRRRGMEIWRAEARGGKGEMTCLSRVWLAFMIPWN